MGLVWRLLVAFKQFYSLPLLMPCSIRIGISTIPALAHSSDQSEASESIAMGMCKLQRSTFPVSFHHG
jgi:hypothetical protein